MGPREALFVKLLWPLVSYSFTRWQHNCINTGTMREILCQSCTDRLVFYCVSFCWDEKLDKGLALSCDSAAVKLCEYSVSHALPTSVINISSFLTFVDCKTVFMLLLDILSSWRCLAVHCCVAYKMLMLILVWTQAASWLVMWWLWTTYVPNLNFLHCFLLEF